MSAPEASPEALHERTAYQYVDTAIGGADRRNHVVKIDTFQPPASAVDVLVSAFYYASALLQYLSTHRNAKDKPTVAGYRGPAWAPAFYMDFDDAADPARALTDARRLVGYLRDDLGVPAAALHPYFSGSKGFHVLVDAAAFGGFTPSADLPDRFAVLGQHWIDTLELRTADGGVHQHLRLLRWPNTRHGKTGRFKIPLSLAELFTLDLAAIQTLAARPRPAHDRPPADVAPAPALVALWERTATATRPRAPHRAPAASTGGGGGSVPEGSRHAFMLSVAAALERRGVSEAGRWAALRALNDSELAEPLPDDEVAQLAAHQHPGGEATNWQADPEQLARERAAAEARAAREHELRLAAEAKAQERGRMLDAVRAHIADPEIGPELRLLLGLALAHYGRDPALTLIAGNRWRLTQKLARTLCGVRSVVTAGNYARKLAAAGLLPLAEPEIVHFTKKNGERVDAEVLTYLYDPPDAKPDRPPEDVAAENRPVLLSRERRLRARREARGDKKRFSGCPDHPHARTTMRRHCAVCDRCIAPKEPNVFATAPAPRPDQGVQGDLRSFDAKPDRPPACRHGIQPGQGVYCVECHGRECENCHHRRPGNRDAICAPCRGKIAAERFALAGAAGGDA